MSKKFKVAEIEVRKGVREYQVYVWDRSLTSKWSLRRGTWRRMGLPFQTEKDAEGYVKELVDYPFVRSVGYYDEHGRKEYEAW